MNGIDVMDYKMGTQSYAELFKKYVALFQQYGFTVYKPDRESIMVENGTVIGAYTIREDGLCAGAMYLIGYKDELLAGFEQEKKRCNRWNPRMGWFFYEEMRTQCGGRGNHDLSFGEVELMLRGYSGK